MFIHYLAHARRGRPVWHAFKHQRGGAAGQRAVQQVAVTGDPAHIGGAPVDIARMIIKDVFEGSRRIHQVAAGSVQHAFRLAGRAGGIEDEQRVFGVHFHRFMLVIRFFNQIAPPQVTTFLPVDFAAGAFEYHYVLDAGDVRVFQRIIDVFLQRDGATGA